jgi:hypothetical protein
VYLPHPKGIPELLSIFALNQALGHHSEKCSCILERTHEGDYFANQALNHDFQMLEGRSGFLLKLVADKDLWRSILI